jgi:ABC-type cobalt transport system substrate-binding protein
VYWLCFLLERVTNVDPIGESNSIGSIEPAYDILSEPSFEPSFQPIYEPIYESIYKKRYTTKQMVDSDQLDYFFFDEESHVIHPL